MRKGTPTVLIGIVIIIVAVVVGYAIFHKSSKTAMSTSPYTATSQPTTNNSNSSKPASNSNTILQTKSNSSVGQYLADASGNALYTYGGDKPGISNCSGACVANWPIYQASSTTSLPSNVTVIKRSDGTSQYAYKGLPLYTFTSDSSGQVTGDGVSNFHITKP